MQSEQSCLTGGKQVIYSMILNLVLLAMCIGGCYCTYVPHKNAAEVDKRFVPIIGPSYDICRTFRCGAYAATYDPRWQSCRCGNYALCYTRDTCHVAMAGCQYDHVDCEYGHCICRTQHAHQNSVNPTDRTGYSCHNRPCGAYSSSWDPYGRICRCGIYAYCDHVDRCKYVLASCPREMRACEKGICVCRPVGKHSHSTKPSTHPTNTVPSKTQSHKPIFSWVKTTESTTHKTTLKTTIKPSTTMTQTTTSTASPTVPSTTYPTTSTTKMLKTTTTATASASQPLKFVWQTIPIGVFGR